MNKTNESNDKQVLMQFDISMVKIIKYDEIQLSKTIFSFLCPLICVDCKNVFENQIRKERDRN